MLNSNFNDESSSSMFVVDVSSKIGKEYIPLVDDVARMVLIQFMIQFMFHLSLPNFGLLTEEFVLLLLYIILGVCLYWLVFRNLVLFK